MGKKKDKKKTVVKKEYPTFVEQRAKEAMALEPPEYNEFKMENEATLDKFAKFRPRYKQKYETIKERARMKNN
jgi:hypothetical protein